MIKKCKICGKTFSKPNTEMKVYPDTYDHDACEKCNSEQEIKSK
jgi:hypothetical protein